MGERAIGALTEVVAIGTFAATDVVGRVATMAGKIWFRSAMASLSLSWLPVAGDGCVATMAGVEEGEAGQLLVLA